METKEFLGVYPWSFGEAKRLNEVDLWKASHAENVACKDAIEQVIRTGFDGMHLTSDCAKSITLQFGYHRTAYVLADSLQQKDFDGRFSRANHDWAKQTYIPPDLDSYTDRNADFAVDSHPAVLDGFVNQYRKAYQELGLFDYSHCLPDTDKQDFEGKVIVLRADGIKDSCLTPQSQLWLCSGGFGAHPDSSGRAVFATCLADGETARLYRTDFAGVLVEANLPEWAAEKLQAMQEQTAPEQTGPEMTM